MDQRTARTVDLQVDNEIVVEHEHLRLVGGALADFGVEVLKEDVDGRLGLGRLTLSGEAASADTATTDPGLAGAVRTDWVQALGAILVGGGPAPTNLDVCLAAMRSRFAAAYGGFQPTMGKNREIADIEGLPYISGGGTSKVPVPAGPVELDRPESAADDCVRVGVADTPIFAHPQLTGRYDDATDAEFYPDGTAQPAAGHATFIAGLVLQRAPGAFLVVRPVLDAGARGTSWAVARSLMAFLDEENRVDVLPLAFGTYARDGRPPLVLARAVERLAPHTVVLAAAGNHGAEPATAEPGRLTRRTVAYPAAIDGVCAVAAADTNGELASFSPPVLPWFQLKAPGVEVASLYLHGPVQTGPDGDPEKFAGFARWSGSSFAVATVAGEIAKRTVPGRRTAREALDDILAGAAREDGIDPV